MPGEWYNNKWVIGIAIAIIIVLILSFISENARLWFISVKEAGKSYVCGAPVSVTAVPPPDLLPEETPPVVPPVIPPVVPPTDTSSGQSSTSSDSSSTGSDQSSTSSSTSSTESPAEGLADGEVKFSATLRPGTYIERVKDKYLEPTIFESHAKYVSEIQMGTTGSSKDTVRDDLGYLPVKYWGLSLPKLACDMRNLPDSTAREVPTEMAKDIPRQQKFMLGCLSNCAPGTNLIDLDRTQ
jgi:hypothetical protein